MHSFCKGMVFLPSNLHRNDRLKCKKGSKNFFLMSLSVFFPLDSEFFEGRGKSNEGTFFTNFCHEIVNFFEFFLRLLYFGGIHHW
jgi:hypothetical protein